MKKIKIVIATDGTYTMTPVEGYAGSSCVQKTQTIEQLIGGTAVASGKTDDYYKADASFDIIKNIDNML